MTDDDTTPDDYDRRAEATLAYRLMEHLAFRGLLTDIEVSNLRYPPIELIEDAEAVWDE
jgi:hypothetical protein